MNEPYFPPDKQHFSYTGRIDFDHPDRPRLIGPGAKISFTFHGTKCTVILQDQHRYNGHNYIVIILDDTYFKRIRLQNDSTHYTVAEHLEATAHTITICKATESQVGYLDFLGVSCSDLSEPPPARQHLIEFIGDSVTAGSGIDTSSVDCDRGTWYDQHNAYLSYGAITARNLDADWILSAVSGIGLCRFWNRESPSMSTLYERLYLDAPPQGMWQSDRQPGCIVIALGTNDFNNGDGSYERAPVEQIDFVGEYVRFIDRLRRWYGSIPLCLLTSPLFSGERDNQLRNYLSEVTTRVANNIELFMFSTVFEGGCDGHPGLIDHRSMADELTVFLKRFLKW